MGIALSKEKVTNWIGKYKYLVLIILVGVGLMLIPDKNKDTETVPATNAAIPEVTLDKELESILSGIQGAGKVRVMLTVKSGEQFVYQTDVPGTDRQDTVIITGQDREETGLVEQVLAPTYRGAIVLCQGADSPAVCLAIKENRSPGITPSSTSSRHHRGGQHREEDSASLSREHRHQGSLC